MDVDLFHTKNMIGLEPYNKLRRFEWVNIIID
jgi:hypothetical protein